MVMEGMIVTRELRKTMMTTIMGWMTVKTRWTLMIERARTAIFQMVYQITRKKRLGVPRRDNQGPGK
jgi:hypothetical protein